MKYLLLSCILFAGCSEILPQPTTTCIQCGRIKEVLCPECSWQITPGMGQVQDKRGRLVHTVCDPDFRRYDDILTEREEIACEILKEKERQKLLNQRLLITDELLEAIQQELEKLKANE